MKVLLIPSAVLVPDDMRNKFGELPTALFPLGNKTMLEHIYEAYKDKVDKAYIVVYKKKLLVKDYTHWKKIPIEIIELDELKDLGYTINYGLQYILKQEINIEYIYINFADSLLDNDYPNERSDFAYFCKSYMNRNEWTYFEDREGKIHDIYDKDVNDDFTRENYKKFFIGVFGLNNPGKLLLLLEEKRKEDSETDSFYRALRDYSQKSPFNMIEIKKWFDVGHAEKYIQATTSVAARAFNSIEIDEKRGILKKRSENKEKLVNEISWYLRIPNKIQYLIPRIYDYSLDLNEPYVSMEYYGYHTLHENLVYGNLPLVKWQDIFQKLHFAINDMEKFKVNSKEDDFVSAMHEIYLEKTFKRLEKMKKQIEFRPFFSEPIKINEKEYLPLNEYISLLPRLVEKVLVDSFVGKFNIIHGDLCFANVLIENTYDFIRLIDPRGKFGSFDIYGDSRYEIAKLMHTIEGKYDFIIEDMFELDVIGTQINYRVHKYTDDILRIFSDVFSDKLKDIMAIRLIESTLFLSMIPLHHDSKKRQFAMLATGVMLLDRVIKELKGK